MTCEYLGNGVVVCGIRGKKPKPRPCATCGRDTTHLCDGPPYTPKAKTCDRPVCERCSLRLLAMNLDFCPTCACTNFVLTCRAGVGTCAGPDTDQQLCAKHAFAFLHWRSQRGGLQVYQLKLDREAKRDVFRAWLGTQLGQTEVEELWSSTMLRVTTAGLR